MARLEDKSLVLDSRFTEADATVINEFIELVKETEHKNILALLESMRCDHCNEINLDDAIELIKGSKNG
jgi:hypothetical protein